MKKNRILRKAAATLLAGAMLAGTVSAENMSLVTDKDCFEDVLSEKMKKQKHLRQKHI